MVGLWEGVPAGFVLQLPPVTVGVTSALGSTCATLLVLVLGDRVRARLLRRRPEVEGAAPRERAIDRVWRRYGTIGLGLLGPGLTGAPLAVALGLVLGAATGRLLRWTLLGITLWAAALTIVGTYSAAGLARLLGHQP